MRTGLTIVVMLLAGSCASASTSGQPSPSATPAEAIAVEDAPATPDPTPPASNEPASDQIPVGLITPTGVTVAVIGLTDAGFGIRTPCGRAAEIADGTPINTVTVVIDPGHGGQPDPGAVGPGGLIESELNLLLSSAVAFRLSNLSVAVALTRTGDYLSPLSVRSKFADDVGAELMVSIHHNAPLGDPSDVPGTEVFVQSGSVDSRRIGGLLYEEVSEALNQFDVTWTAAPDAGVLEVRLPDGRDAYGMIRRPETPTALLELGYLANPAEEALFGTDAYIQAASAAVSDAIIAYLDTDGVGTGHGNPAREFLPQRAPGADVCTDPVLE